MTEAQKARALAGIAQQKAHIDAVRRLQLAFEKELQAAGVRGEAVRAALATLNSEIGRCEDEAGTVFDDLLFEMTKGE